MNLLLNYIKYFSPLLGILIYWSCAAIMSPSGGEKDTIPPELIETIPANRSTQFKGGRVELIFSEYLDAKTVDKGIRVLPYLPDLPQIIYKGRRVFIEFPESLPKNQTYIIIINRDLTDEHKVKLSQSIQIAFSTGDKIDGASISGKVYYPNLSSVNLWKIKEESDLYQFYKRSPDYVVDTGDSGNYEFKYLSSGTYRLAAVDQSISGLQIITDRMVYGMSWKPHLELKDQEQLNNVDIRIPTQSNALKMVSAEWMKGAWGQITFSKDIIGMIDNMSLNVIYADLTQADLNIFNDPLDKKKINFITDKLISDYISINTSGISIDGNSVIDSSLIKIKMDTTTDTTAISVIYPQEKHVVNVEQDSIVPLKVVFSSIVDYENSKGAFIIMEDSLSIKLDAIWTSPLSVNLLPNNNWKPKTLYSLIIKKDSIPQVYGDPLKDSLTTITFRTTEFQRFGSLIVNPINKTPMQLVVELSKIEKESTIYRTNVKSLGTIRINQLPEDNYNLFFFQDLNGDNKHSTGTIDPFLPAEWFQVYPDTIKIRANWELELNHAFMGIK